MKKLKVLFENNKGWASEKMATDPTFFSNLSEGQVPAYLWIGCSDSRVPANEIVGLEMPKILKKSVVIFFLSFRQDNSRNKKRNLITKRIVDKNSFVTISINFEDANPLFNIIDSVILFDLASYYLALFNKVDPMAVKRISLLKNGMKK